MSTHPRPNVTIQINSLEALERLLGGDTEMEVSLRQSVAAEFAKRHLKELASTPIVQKAIRETRDALEMGHQKVLKTEVGTIVRDNWDRIKAVELNPALISAMREQVRAQLALTRDLITQEVVSQFDLQAAVDRAVESNINTKVERLVGQRIEAVMKGLKV